MFEGYPEIGQGLVVMTNSDSGLPLIGEIQRAVAQEYSWPDGRVEEHTLTKIDPPTLRASLKPTESCTCNTLRLAITRKSCSWNQTLDSL